MAKKVNGRSDPVRQEKIEQLMECRPRLRVYALSLTRDRDRADDLVQDALVKGLTHIDSFESGTNMAAWIFRVMRNLFISEFRTSRSKYETSWNPDVERVATSQIVESEADATLDLHTMLLYLACLERNQSDAVIGAGYLGMDYESMAERLGCSVGTIKSRVSRGRTTLLRLMEETAVEQVDTTWLKTATRGVPKSHPYYPIAKAYEDLYAAAEGVSNGHNSNGVKDAAPPSQSEKLWQELVASGALDDAPEDLSSLMQGTDDM